MDIDREKHKEEIAEISKLFHFVSSSSKWNIEDTLEQYRKYQNIFSLLMDKLLHDQDYKFNYKSLYIDTVHINSKSGNLHSHIASEIITKAGIAPFENYSITTPKDVITKSKKKISKISKEKCKSLIAYPNWSGTAGAKLIQHNKKFLVVVMIWSDEPIYDVDKYYNPVLSKKSFEMVNAWAVHVTPMSKPRQRTICCKTVIRHKESSNLTMHFYDSSNPTPEYRF